MSVCKDCIHYPVCIPYVSPNESFPEVEGGCGAFKAKADLVEKKQGKWRRMYRQYQCSSCGAVIDERQDNGLYGMINFGERKPYCYWCGSCNDFERSENGT